ncbi:MAG: cardiolipin synthase [Bacilli bacterium]|nr:cardiolipin synthase [Bacilli bacterium]
MKSFRRGIWQKFVSLFILLLVVASFVAMGVLLVLGILSSRFVVAFTFILFLINLMVMLFILNNGSEDTYKISWLYIVGAVPLVGLFLYLLLAHKLRTRKEERSLERYFDILSKSKTEEGVLESLEKSHPEAANIASFLIEGASSPLFSRSKATYFSPGEKVLEVFLAKLESAKHYIHLEFFIFGPGKVYDRIIDILKRKVKEGVKVRLLYDDIGNLNKTPVHFWRKLQKMGIEAKVYRHITPIFDIRLSNRDHRKIAVIDGHTSFTGGINLSDEYFNITHPFGYWKDNLVMIEGPATYGLNALFLANWKANVDPKLDLDIEDIAYERYSSEISFTPDPSLFVQPYGDIPYSDEAVGEAFYLSLIYKAKRYCYITTPYLIINQKVETALIIAAKSGVDVRIITPGIPDKKSVFELTRRNYGRLLRAGVKIYEYTPGFIHMKTFVVDDLLASVGSINLDYRSMFLNSEVGVYFVGGNILKEIKGDLIQILHDSKEISYQQYKLWEKKRRFGWAILRFLEPLL